MKEHDLDLKAHIALHLLMSWGMVQGKDGGEDSAGRSRFDLMTPEEAAKRAADLSEAITSEIEERGWLASEPLEEPATDVAKKRWFERL